LVLNSNSRGETVSLPLVLAQAAAEPAPIVPWHGLLAAALFGALGIALLFLGYKVFDWLTPHLHIEKDLADKNVAVAIVVAAMLISLSIIVAKSFG
jgi:putative membrane protein